MHHAIQLMTSTKHRLMPSREMEHLSSGTDCSTTNFFMVDGHTPSLPRLAQLINAQFDQDELSTNHIFNMIDTQSPHNPSPIQLIAAHPGPSMAGSDGLVDPFDGPHACAYCIQIDSIRYSGAMRYPSSAYSTSHQSELEGVYNTLLIKQHLCNRLPITQHVDNSEAPLMHPITQFTHKDKLLPLKLTSY